MVGPERKREAVLHVRHELAVSERRACTTIRQPRSTQRYRGRRRSKDAALAAELRRISAAHPRVASYPFTTLTPHIGVVELAGYERITVADIPGLIEGAHADVGVGHDFLRHIVRCKLLVFVLDMAGSEGREPLDDLQKLRKELDLYDPKLSERPGVVVANKMDLEEAAERLEGFRQRYPKIEIIPISAQEGEGIEKLKERIGVLVLGERTSVNPFE